MRIRRTALFAVVMLAHPPLSAQDFALSTEVQTIAAAHNVDPELVHAVIGTESNYNYRAKSPKGAIGLMQLMPATARRFGVSDPYDPVQNLKGGIAYLRWLLDFFQGNVQLALAGYNAGEGAVLKHGGIPPYRETVAYVQKVLNRWGKPTKASTAAPLVQATVSAFSPKIKAKAKPALTPVLNPYTADTTVFSRLNRVTQDDRQNDQPAE